MSLVYRILFPAMWLSWAAYWWLASRGAKPADCSARRRAPREPEHWNYGVLTPRSGRVLRHDQCAFCGLTIHSSRRRFAARLNSGVRLHKRSARAGHGPRNPHRQLSLRRYHVRGPISFSSVCSLSLSSLPQGHGHGARYKLVRCARPISMDFRSRSRCTVRSCYSGEFRNRFLSKLWLAASSSDA